MLPEVAVMVVVPGEMAVTKPEVVILATEVLLDDHATDVVTLPLVPSEYVAVAVACCDVPLLIVVPFCRLIAMLVIVLLLTVKIVVAKTLPDLA